MGLFSVTGSVSHVVSEILQTGTFGNLRWIYLVSLAEPLETDVSQNPMVA